MNQTKTQLQAAYSELEQRYFQFAERTNKSLNKACDALTESDLLQKKTSEALTAANKFGNDCLGSLDETLKLLKQTVTSLQDIYKNFTLIPKLEESID